MGGCGAMWRAVSLGGVGGWSCSAAQLHLGIDLLQHTGPICCMAPGGRLPGRARARHHLERMRDSRVRREAPFLARCSRITPSSTSSTCAGRSSGSKWQDAPMTASHGRRPSVHVTGRQGWGGTQGGARSSGWGVGGVHVAGILTPTGRGQGGTCGGEVVRDSSCSQSAVGGRRVGGGRRAVGGGVGGGGRERGSEGGGVQRGAVRDDRSQGRGRCGGGGGRAQASSHALKVGGRGADGVADGMAGRLRVHG